MSYSGLKSWKSSPPPTLAKNYISQSFGPDTNISKFFFHKNSFLGKEVKSTGCSVASLNYFKSNYCFVKFDYSIYKKNIQAFIIIAINEFILNLHFLFKLWLLDQ